jgi:hypothetical protein
MITAVTTVLFKGDVEKTIDLNLPLVLTMEQCLEQLKEVRWLPEDWDFRCEVSVTGEVWKKLELKAALTDAIYGDGAIIQILPY